MARDRSAGSSPAAPDPRLVEAARGALLGTFVGDALGMPYEGMPGAAVPETLEMVEARLGRGTYTDDTQTMIALAESLLRCDVVDETDLAATLLAHFDPGRGYGGGMRRVFDLWRDGVPVEEAAGAVYGGSGSFGNGAAMRIAPVAVRFFDDAAVLDVQARRSARVTHRHPAGIEAAAVQAAAVAAAVDGVDSWQAAQRAASSPDMRRALAAAGERVGGGLDPAALAPGPGGVPATGDLSVAAAILAGTRAADFEQAVTVAIRAGGDTDTTGAMAGAIAGARFGAGAIPARWRDALEGGERGREHVERLARDLAERAASAVTSGPRR